MQGIRAQSQCALWLLALVTRAVLAFMQQRAYEQFCLVLNSTKEIIRESRVERRATTLFPRLICTHWSHEGRSHQGTHSM